MADDTFPEEPSEPAELSTDRLWKLGEVRPGQAHMDWGSDAEDDEPDDQ
jgi:hypothetical protein